MDFFRSKILISEKKTVNVFSKMVIFWHVFGILCGKKFVLLNTVFTMKTKMEHGKGILDLIQSS